MYADLKERLMVNTHDSREMNDSKLAHVAGGAVKQPEAGDESK